MPTTSSKRCAPGGAGGAPVLVIDRLAAGGDGVGRIGAKVAFVPRTAPGDKVEVEICEQRRTWCRARVLRLVEPGPDRATPPCPSFGVCGGCDWQHLTYPAQLAAKRSIVEDALRRIGRLDPPTVAPTLPSPLELGYRHRARLHTARLAGAAAFGFFRPGSHSVVPLETCPVLHPALNEVLAILAETGRHFPAAFALCPEVRIDTGWDGAAVRLLLRAGRGEPAALPGAAAQAMREAAAVRGIRLLLGEPGGEPLALGPGPDALVTTGETFTQVNLRQNAALVALVIAVAAPAAGEEVLDLCCGLGNLALPAAARGGRVTGVDLDERAVLQARENARRLGRAATFVRDDAVAAVRALAAAGRRFPLVLLNPPRTGAREAVAAIPALCPSRIVVVSCDPATLARDAAALAGAGYLLDSARPVDLFPQTAHVETVTLFRRDLGS
jgi:23S rRNA (uracil1939-C5)-methyltransferase